MDSAYMTLLEARAIIAEEEFTMAYTPVPPALAFDGYHSRRVFCALGCFAASDMLLGKGQQTMAIFPTSASTEQHQAKSGGPPSRSTTGGDEIFHVAIFRFGKEHVNDAMAAFRELASASRRELGNLRYDIYRGIDDDQEFYVVEDWASPAALTEHERTEAFIHFGQGLLARYATLHDAVTARPFDVA
jgi:quinol monooxygenase YgiN